MFEIIEDWKSILNALVAAPLAWQSPAELATALGRDVEETKDLLSVMDDADWLTVWEVEPGPLVTLSALAAHRLKVVLVEVGPDEVGPEELPLLRWAPEDEPTPPPTKAGDDIALTDHFARQSHLLDPTLPPDEAAESFERRGARATRVRPRFAAPLRVEDLPLPVLLLGQNLTPWPGPDELIRSDVCPACAGGPLLPYMYCLVCDRWGLDEALEKLAPKSTTSRPTEPRSSRSSTPKESASPVGEVRSFRSDEHRPFPDKVSRSRARRNEGRKALLSTRVVQG